VAKEKDCKEFGLSLLLNDFIAGINMLSSDGLCNAYMWAVVT